MAHWIATSKPTSSFNVPANHVWFKLSAWRFPTTWCSVLKVTTQSTPRSPSRAPDKQKDNNDAVPQVASVTSGGTINNLNQSSGPTLVVGFMPFNVSSAAPMSLAGPEIVPVGSYAMPQTEPIAFTVQGVAQVLASSRKNSMPEWKLARL